MPDSSITLFNYLRKLGIDLDGDFLKKGTRLLTQLAAELEGEQVIGSSLYQCSEN